MEMPTINENAAYILKNSPSFRFREVDEDTFAQRARRQILTPRGADGRFLTDSPVDFFLTTGGVMHARGGGLMRPGSVKRDGYTSRGKFGKSRPVIVMEEEYPGLPIEAVADIVEGHARILHRLERAKNREGPDISRLVQYPTSLLSVVNDGLERDARDRIEKMLEIHSTYRYRVLGWLKRKFRGPKVGFDINKGRMAGHAISSSQTTGYLLPLGHLGRDDSLLGTVATAIIEIDATRTIRRPEVAIALDYQSGLNEKGFQTLLCSASLRRMLLYVTGPNIEEFLATTRAGHPMVLPGSGLEHQVTATLRGDTRATKLPVLSPLSLYIPPPPPKTSSKTKGMFSHDFTGYGYAIAPIHNEDFDPFFDAHPIVVAYNIGKHTRIVSAFLRSAGLTKAIEDPHIITVEDDSLLQAFLNHRSRTQTFVETLPMEEPQVTYALPYGKEVIVKASASGSKMAGFTDGSIRAGMVQLREIEALMPEGETIILYGRLAAFPTLDPETPKNLLSFKSSEWEDVVLHIEGIVGDKNPKKDLTRISFLLGDHIMPVRHARGDVLPIYEDEIVHGSARMLGFIHEGKRSYFLSTHLVAATVLALHTDNKRFKNGEAGTVLLGVMSEEKRPVVYTDNKGEVVRTARRKTTIYNSIGKVGTMRGFTVEDRRALFDHLVKYGTHTEGDWLFVDPLTSDTILDVEFSHLKIAQAKRFAREVQMVRNEERFATDAMKGIMMTGVFKDIDKRDVEPVLPVAQGAHKAGTRRPDYVYSDYARLTSIDSAILPQVVDARIVGIRSKIQGLAYKVDAKTALTEKTMYETDEGLVFSTDINLDQFNYGASRRHPPHIEASLNPGGEYSRHRQIEQWRFKREPTQLGVDSKSRLRTYNIDHPMVKHFIGWNDRYEGYEGAKAIVAPLRDDLKDNWAVQTILVPKKYGVRRTANEIRLDSLEPPKWYQKAHPGWKKPKGEDILAAAKPKHRAWVEPPLALTAAEAMVNPPVFDSPDAMDMGIQYGDKTGPSPEGKASSTKWHNQTLDGKNLPSSLSDIPYDALAWKKGGFLSETGMHSKTHEDGTHTVGFVEEYADDPRPYIVSLKIDGDSSLAHFDGKQTVIWNKRGRWRRHFHITDQITASLKKKGVKSAKIAGELYAVGEDGETLPLNKINSIIVAPKTIDRQKQIRFAGFDIVELDGEDLSEAPYEDRVSKVDGLLKGGEIMTVPFFHSKGGMKEVQKAWDEGMKQPNFEGLVLRFEGMAKSHKIKMKGTADLAVIGFFQGKSPGRLENSVAGAMLAWMLPNGDFVYAGKSVIGKSDKEKEKMVSDLLKAKVEAPLFNIGGRTVDSSRTHNDRGKGTFTMVKPWRVSEHDYRSINWSKKPVFRFSKGKVEIVGEMNAPTMHTPTFKRWRDDKSINAHDLRMEQVPIEGTGKWGQIDA